MGRVDVVLLYLTFLCCVSNNGVIISSGNFMNKIEANRFLGAQIFALLAVLLSGA